MTWEDVDWGDVPTWATAAVTAVAAVAAVFTLVAALWAGLAAWNAYRLARDESRSAQAGRIGAWFDTRPRGEPTNLTIVNQSDMPVWDLTVHVVSLPSGTVVQVVRTPVLPPTDRGKATFHMGSTGRIPPVGDTDQACAVWFRDSRNMRWERTWWGDLRPAPPPEEIATAPPYRLA